MNARLLPYILILPVTLFLCLFFLYPFILVSQQAFSTGAGFTLDNFRRTAWAGETVEIGASAWRRR